MMANRRPRSLLVGVLTLGIMSIGASPPAHAFPIALQPVPDTTWQTDGMTRTYLQVGHLIYVGGEFGQLRQTPVGQVGATIPAANLAAFDAATGAPFPSFLPQVTGPAPAVVYDMAASGGILYVGGLFSAVDGVSRKNLAAFNIADPASPSFGTLLPFNPRPAGIVWALAATDTRLFVGGVFPSIAGETHGNVAAFSLPAGTIDTAFDPSTSGPTSEGGRVRDIEMVGNDPGAILIVGDFYTVTGANGTTVGRRAIAKLLGDGTVASWAVPDSFFGVSNWGIDAYVDVPHNRVYLGTGGSDWVSALALSSGLPLWKTDTNGSAQAVTLIDDTLVVGGHFRSIGLRPGYLNCYGAFDPHFCAIRTRLAALDPATGVLDLRWNPEVSGHYNGVWQAYTSPDGRFLWLAGEFKKAGGVPRSYVARFSHVPV